MGHSFQPARQPETSAQGHHSGQSKDQVPQGEFSVLSALKTHSYASLYHRLGQGQGWIRAVSAAF